MRMTRILAAAAIGLGAVFSQGTPVTAQTLRVLEGETSATLRVPMNRAVVVESDMLFAELSVANPAIADIATLSERSIYILGRAPGRTTMTLLSAEGSLIANVEIQVVPDVAELRERLGEILPGEAVEVRTANDGIVLSGTVSSLQAVDRAMQLAERYTPGGVSNMMQVGGTQQVMLQVRFAEMQRSVRQELSSSLNIGNNDAIFGSNGLANTNPTGVPTIVPDGLDQPERRTFHRLRVGISPDRAPFWRPSKRTAWCGRSQSRTCSALSGQTAEFLAGGEYPIPVQGEDGIGVEFKPFGVNMNFTPTVVEGEIINLNLTAEVSSIGEIQPGTNIPVLNTRRAGTTVELRDGESFAIAGLLQDDFRDSIGQVPWLGDLPVLGALFRSANYSRQQTELVVIVTAPPREPGPRRGAGPAHRPRHDPDRGRPVPARPHHGSPASGHGSRRCGGPRISAGPTAT